MKEWEFGGSSSSYAEVGEAGGWRAGHSLALPLTTSRTDLGSEKTSRINSVGSCWSMIGRKFCFKAAERGGLVDAFAFQVLLTQGYANGGGLVISDFRRVRINVTQLRSLNAPH